MARTPLHPLYSGVPPRRLSLRSGLTLIRGRGFPGCSMPNLVGLWHRSSSRALIDSILSTQISRVARRDIPGCQPAPPPRSADLHVDRLSGHQWAAARIDPGILPRTAQPGWAPAAPTVPFDTDPHDTEHLATDDHPGAVVQVLLDGEVLNLDDLADAANLSPVYRQLGPAHLIAGLIQHHGLDIVSRFNGLFALVVSEDGGRRLTLVSDRYGFRPLFWRHDGERLMFATELKAIIGPGLGVVATDACSVAEALVYGTHLNGRTWAAGCQRLAPATLLTLAAGRLTQTQYWTYRYRHEGMTRARSIAGLADEFGERLGRAVIRATEAGGRVGIFLSGGYDSRSVAAAIPPAARPLPAFTFGAPDSRDVRIAPLIAQRLGLTHCHLRAGGPALARIARPIVWRTEGLIPFSNTTSLQFHDEISAQADVILTGFLGEFSGSHTWPQLLLARNRRDAHAAIQARFVDARLDKALELLRPDRRADIREQVLERFQASLGSIEDEHPIDIADSWNMRNLQPGGTFQSPAVDRHRFEVRAPHMDNDLVDFLLTIAPWTRIEQRVYKTMIARRYPQIRDIPCANSLRPIEPRFWIEYPRMVLDLAGRKIAGPARRLFGREDRLGRELSDIHADYRAEPALRETLLEPLLAGGHIDPEVFDTARVLGRTTDHFDHGGDHAVELGVVLSMGLARQMLLADPDRADSHECFDQDAARMLAAAGA